MSSITGVQQSLLPQQRACTRGSTGTGRGRGAERAQQCTCKLKARVHRTYGALQARRETGWRCLVAAQVSAHSMAVAAASCSSHLHAAVDGYSDSEGWPKVMIQHAGA